MKKQLFLAFYFYSFFVYAPEVVLEAFIISGSTIPTSLRIANRQPYGPNNAHLIADNKSVLVGYTNKDIAQQAILQAISQQDEIANTIPALEPMTPYLFHIKIVAGYPSPQDAQKALPNSMVSGTSFDIVNNKGWILKKKCYILTTRQRSFGTIELGKALDAISTAIQGQSAVIKK